MKPQTVSIHLVQPHPEVAATLLNPEPGVFLADGRRARRPKDPHGFCAGEYILWVNGVPVKHHVAAATQTGFLEVTP